MYKILYSGKKFSTGQKFSEKKFGGVKIFLSPRKNRLKCVLKLHKSVPEEKNFFENFQNLQKMAAAPNWIGGLG